MCFSIGLHRAVFSVGISTAERLLVFSAPCWPAKPSPAHGVGSARDDLPAQARGAAGMGAAGSAHRRPRQAPAVAAAPPPRAPPRRGNYRARPAALLHA